VESQAAGKAPAISVSANVPINPIIVNNTPQIINVGEIFDILSDPLQSDMNVWDVPPGGLDIVMRSCDATILPVVSA